MKYLLISIFLFGYTCQIHAQGTIPDEFFAGKSVVLVSNAPQARPLATWQELAEALHPALMDAGGDPVGYYELEQLTLSEETQAGYAAAFIKRQINTVIILTRKANGTLHLHIGPFSNSKQIIQSSVLWGIDAISMDNLAEQLSAFGKSTRSKNYLVLDVPEFLGGEQAVASSTSRRFLARNPLNLDVFKLGVRLASGTSEAVLSNFRYDLLGKSEERIAAEQAEERNSLEQIFEEYYPHQVAYLTTAKTDQELIADRVQFQLIRVEGREADLLQSMGLPIQDPEKNTRIVVKFYIRLIVRDELYIGPTWDADPNWRIALTNFLKNLAL
ncbi:NTPase [Mongoliitalea daihaiensis]|uniref:NTPase n=1 Tax=Mongoliitalea daihaiensis TaxID=2782006 RepID=UPI001F48B980|nr:NTPase [Mongoliitalea daihaiensis]UJP66164.1 NTPase [Mongoliitalea daihaiensis]